MKSIVERLREDIDTNARHVAADRIEELEAEIAALTPPTDVKAESSVEPDPAPNPVDAPSEPAPVETDTQH